MKITRNPFLEDTNVSISSMIFLLFGNEIYQGLGFLLVNSPTDTQKTDSPEFKDERLS